MSTTPLPAPIPVVNSEEHPLEGGGKRVAYFLDANHVPTSKDRAEFMEILEFDKDGNNTSRTYLVKEH